MQKIDELIFSIHSWFQNHKKKCMIRMCVLDLLLFFYYLVFLPIFPISTYITQNDSFWYHLYNIVNPFTLGSYILGLVVLLQYIMYNSTLSKVILGLFYGMVVFTSLVAIMGMTHIGELYIYLPHIIIVILCVLVSYRKYLNRKKRLKYSGIHYMHLPSYRKYNYDADYVEDYITWK